METPKMNVKCSVDCCDYWKDNCCHASALEVNPMTGKKSPHTSDETSCTTFKPSSK